MKNIHKQSKRDETRSSAREDAHELLETLEDHQSNDESPEDHCSNEENSRPVLRARTPMNTLLR